MPEQPDDRRTDHRLHSATETGISGNGPSISFISRSFCVSFKLLLVLFKNELSSGDEHSTNTPGNTELLERCLSKISANHKNTNHSLANCAI